MTKNEDNSVSFFAVFVSQQLITGETCLRVKTTSGKNIQRPTTDRLIAK